MEQSFDLIVIGAGTAGCLAAFSAAKAGLARVALVDRKPKELIGRKVCGDGIGTKHIQFLLSKGLPLDEETVVTNYTKTAQLISPNDETTTTFEVHGQLAIIDRHKFGQALLAGALSSGAILLDSLFFTSLERKAALLRAHFRNKAGSAVTLTAPLIIDASGINSKIREKPQIFGPHTAVLRDDEQYYCYREICELDNAPPSYSDSAVFKFSYEHTKGGYMWYFNRTGKEYNVGTGVPKSWTKSSSPQTIFQNVMLRSFSKGRVLASGGGFVPTRHPLGTHVSDNIILTGDAGLIVNPLHGGGLGASLASGYLAGELAARQVPAEALSMADLWSFN